jgi:ribonuclease D
LTILQPLPFEIVSQSAQLEAAVREIAGSIAIALDTESNSRHHYPEQLCLIQLATRQKIYIIDTISLRDIAPLEQVLADAAVMKVVHGADYDIRCLDRHHGFRIRNLYDTSIAARFAGLTDFGLTALIKNMLGVTILKSERLQQSDWGRRPLSSEALDYASSDVRHLLDLQEVLEQRIQNLGRAAWVAEECARLEEVRYCAPNLQTAYLGVKGARELDGAALAVLRSIYLFREEESRRQGRPPFFVIPDMALITLANNPTANLSQVPGIGPVGLQRFGRRLQQALIDGQAELPIKIPPVIIECLNNEQVIRLRRLKAWRTALSTALFLDPALCWPTISLERLAKTPDTFEAEINSANIRRWQRDQFASALHPYLKSVS